MADLERVVRTIRIRLRIFYLLDALFWGLLLGLAGACLVIFSLKLFPNNVDAWLLASIVTATTLLLAGCGALVRRLTLFEAALAADQRLNLRERLSSALALHLAGRTDSPAYQALAEDARLFAARIRPSQDLRYQVPRHARYSFLPALLLGGLYFMPQLDLFRSPLELPPPPPPAPLLTDDESREQSRQLRELAETARKQAEETEDSTVLELSRELEKLSEDVSLAGRDRREVQAEMSRLQDEIKLRQRDVTRQLQPFRQLKGLSQARHTQELQQALKNQDFKAAAEQMQQLAEQMSDPNTSTPEDKREAAEELRQMAESLKENPDVSKALEEAAKALEEAAKEQEAKKQEEEKKEQGQQDQSPGQQGDQGQQGQTQQQEQGGGQQQGQQQQQGGQSSSESGGQQQQQQQQQQQGGGSQQQQQASAQQQQGGQQGSSQPQAGQQQGQQGQSGQQQQSQGGQASQQASAALQNAAQSLQNMQSAAEQMQRLQQLEQGLSQCQGGGQQPGRNPGAASQGEGGSGEWGEGEPNEGDGTGSGNPGRGGGEVPDDGSMAIGFSDVFIQGEQNDGEIIAVFEVDAPVPAGESRIDFTRVPAAVRQRAADSIQQTEIPAGMRNAVRGYFEAINLQQKPQQPNR